MEITKDTKDSEVLDYIRKSVFTGREIEFSTNIKEWFGKRLYGFEVKKHG